MVSSIPLRGRPTSPREANRSWRDHRFMLATLETQFGSRPEGDSFWVRWAPAPGEPADPGLILVHRSKLAEFYIHGHWSRPDRREIPVHQSNQTVAAFVNDSRWVVQCPGCNGAQIASREDRRFFCVDCLNATVGGQWLRVVWPRDAEDVEHVLNARPDPGTRNWNPGETVGDLRRENAAHQVAA